MELHCFMFHKQNNHIYEDTINFLNTNCYFNVLRKFINKDNNMNYKDTSKETLNKHINHILDICDSIPVDKITILTGGNALGKSLIRKQLAFSHVE